MKGRIWFDGNPWPQGHAIEDFQFGAYLHEAGVGLSLLLQSGEYDDADGDEEPPEDADDAGDWGSRGVWGNYHRCTIESGPIALAPALEIESVAKLPCPGQHFRVDPIDGEPVSGFDPQDNSFMCYILGHDAVRDHDIRIESGTAPGLYHFAWDGRVALAYAGDYFYRHRFRARIEDAPFTGFEVTHRQSDGREELSRAERGARVRALGARWLGGLDGLQIVIQSGRLPDRLIPLAGAFRL